MGDTIEWILKKYVVRVRAAFSRFSDQWRAPENIAVNFNILMGGGVFL
jgi:hypothetical protein